MHKGIPHLHSEMLGKLDFAGLTSGLASALLPISNLEIESVTALTLFLAPDTASFFDLQ